MNPDVGYQRHGGTPGWQRPSNADSNSQSSAFGRFSSPLTSTSSSQVPFLSAGNFSSGDGHPFSIDVGLPFSSGAGHSFPSQGQASLSYSSAGHTFTNQSLNSSFSPYAPFKCPDCYAMGSDLFYLKTQYEIMTNKFKAELQQHAMCGPKFLTLESKLEDHKHCEPRIKLLEKDLHEARGYRERCKRAENELEIQRMKCRKLEEELLKIKNSTVNEKVIIKQEPVVFIKQEPVDDVKSQYDSHSPQSYNSNRKSLDAVRNDNRFPQSGARPVGKYARTPRPMNQDQETPKTKRIAVTEKEGDLFDMPSEYSLAHCVGSDFIMSSGVAIKFRKQFRGIPELLEQNKGPGEVAFLSNSDRYIYYLVTKESSTGKPMFDDFSKSVKELRRLCVEHGVKKLAIPKIGCGRDQLDWNEVKRLLNMEFSSTSIDISVCIIHQENLPDKRWNLQLIQAQRPLTDLDPIECALLFIASKDGYITPAIQKLAVKYNFKADYSSFPKSVGGLYHFSDRGGDVNIFGLVVKDRHSDPFSFTKFNECLLPLRRAMKKLHLYYIGFEAFDDVHFTSVTRKIWTTLIDSFFIDEYEIHICWPSDIKEKPWEEKK